MKRMKKYFPLIVGTVILLSVAAYGTRAFFSDSAEEQAGIQLTMGTVDIFSNSENWKYQSNSENGPNNELLIKKEDEFGKMNNLIGMKKAEIKNVLPGDSFSKIFTFENKSTLATNVGFNQTVTAQKNSRYSIDLEIVKASGGVIDKLPDLKGTKITTENYEDETLVLPGKEKAQIKLTVTVNEGDQTIIDGTPEVEILDLLEDTVKVDLKQKTDTKN